jgi:hypothetical protein
LRAKLGSLLGESAKVGTAPRDVVGFPQDHPGTGGIVQRQGGMREFQQRLDGQPRNRIGEQGSQASGPGKVLMSPRRSRRCWAVRAATAYSSKLQM